MDTAAIRRQLHNYLEVAEDKKVKAIYTMMESAIKESAFEYPDEFKTELDKRYSDYKNDKAKMVTPEESRKRIQKILTKGRK